MASNKPITNKLTFKSVREIVKSYGGRLFKTRFGDYKLVFGQAEYFTGSLVDAVGMAKSIWQSIIRRTNKAGKFNG